MELNYATNYLYQEGYKHLEIERNFLSKPAQKMN